MKFAERLHHLLRGAFTEGSLAPFVLFRLHHRLDRIVSAKAGFDVVVFELVLWADQNGRLLDLAYAVAVERPELAEAQRLYRDMGGSLPAGGGSAAPPPALPALPPEDPISPLARAYERIRRVVPDSNSRTVVMEEVVTKMRSLPLGKYALPERLHLSDSEGERLAAIVALRLSPDPGYLRWLSERIAVEYAFLGYHAAVALLEAARSLSIAHLDRVAAAVEQAAEWAVQAGAPSKGGRVGKLEEARQVIANRAAALAALGS